MKISELITRLYGYQSRYGDLTVFVGNGVSRGSPITLNDFSSGVVEEGNHLVEARGTEPTILIFWGE